MPLGRAAIADTGKCGLGLIEEGRGRYIRRFRTTRAPVFMLVVSSQGLGNNAQR